MINERYGLVLCCHDGCSQPAVGERFVDIAYIHDDGEIDEIVEAVCYEHRADAGAEERRG